jgi:hypothetical protein
MAATAKSASISQLAAWRYRGGTVLSADEARALSEAYTLLQAVAQRITLATPQPKEKAAGDQPTAGSTEVRHAS